MRCERCDGMGFDLVLLHNGRVVSYVPCPECGGTGITSCCEGATPCDEVVKEQANDPD